MSSDKGKRSAFSDAATFSDAQKTCAPRHSYSHDKSVFSDTVKKSAFSDAAALVAPESYIHYKSVFSDMAKKSAF